VRVILFGPSAVGRRGEWSSGPAAMRGQPDREPRAARQFQSQAAEATFGPLRPFAVCTSALALPRKGPPWGGPLCDVEREVEVEIERQVAFDDAHDNGPEIGEDIEMEDVSEVAFEDASEDVSELAVEDDREDDSDEACDDGPEVVSEIVPDVACDLVSDIVPDEASRASIMACDSGYTRRELSG